MMLRFYNSYLPNLPQTGVPVMYDKVRRLLIREHALKCRLIRRTLWNVPDTNEAFDGDFAAISRLLSQLMAWGMADFRVAGDSEPELKELTDFYGIHRRFHCFPVPTRVLRAEEAADQDAEVTLVEVPALILESL
jgi:hypothetical protein